MTTPRLIASNPVVLKDGTMTDQFRQWTQLAGLSIPYTGVGSPEGRVEAPQFSLYLDTSAGTGSIQYRKMIDSIGGNKRMGWMLL